MMRSVCPFILLALVVAQTAATGAPKKAAKPVPPSPLEQYINEANQKAAALGSASPGSLWSPPAILSDLASDLRASRLDDLVTVIVSEQASAASTGVTKTQRAASAKASVTALAHPMPPAGALANLLTANSNVQLDGQGTTTRQTTLSTVLTTRVLDVLPNGFLVIEGTKNVLVNSENQVVTLRGVVRPVDLSSSNTVSSDKVGEMELKINGKGVVNDAVHRPNIVYRILLGLLPF